ncbi:hypothetical protein [Acaryochloris marina]|uniref:hypothetical protein n=1 Tax=Acaryochloris marina TaxID=155978 RepID=UPI0021C4285C|nr:hypothetical protein [Acaryochloris marina]BDM83197.1 hypothetical protein AM10699_60580 [Acaryochloris marina MBIC10699]
MDSDERKRLIFLKASANKQRRNRDTFLESLAPPLSQALSSAPCVYTPESHDIISTFLPATADGIGSGSQTRPNEYHYTEVAWPDKAMNLIQQIHNVDPNTDCHLMITPPNAIQQGGKGYWVPTCPLFVVDFASAQRSVPQLWPIAGHFLAIVSCKLEFGMIIDHYCGYLENDFNPTEIVYEVARWPTKAA